MQRRGAVARGSVCNLALLAFYARSVNKVNDIKFLRVAAWRGVLFFVTREEPSLVSVWFVLVG